MVSLQKENKIRNVIESSNRQQAAQTSEPLASGQEAESHK